MQIETQYPYTREQFDALNAEQMQAINAVAQYLIGSTILPEADPTNESITETFNLLKPCHGCVPEEEVDGELLPVIREKFGAVYAVAAELAEQELIQQGLKLLDQFSLCVMIDPSVDDITHVAVLDYKRPVTYLHEWSKSWHFNFATLQKLAEEVLRIKKLLVEQVVNGTKPMELMVVLEGGLVREVVDLPENTHVTVIDYDVEGRGPSDLTISPIDGKLCSITRF